MARRGKSSIVHEVKTAVNQMDRIGQSKRKLRKEGNHGIHSLKQKQETLSAAQNFAKWARKEHGVKSIYQLKEDHYRGYIGFLERGERSVGHRKNVETALRHLQKGMNLRSEHFGKETHVFVPANRVTNWKESKKPMDRSYSREEYQKILAHLPPNSRDAVMLCRELGLRVREAAGVEVRHFQPTEQGWKLMIRNGDGKGITKGGRFREVAVPDRFKAELERMTHGKGSHEKLIAVVRDTVRKAVGVACKKAGITQNERGTHGFRHAYARERVDQLFKERGIREVGHKMVARIMENRDQGRFANYGIHEKDQVVFDHVKEVIDAVHSEIGHGKDRWDLAAVYMR